MIAETKDVSQPVEIDVGSVFMWAGGHPVFLIRNPGGLPVVIRNGYVVTMDRPRRWWSLLAWVRVARRLWAMPR